MQDPRRELPNVISNLTSTSSPSVQRATVLRFFTPDASFAHPLCRVSPGSGSRERILGVYQWYRVLSPVVKSEVVELSWDKHPVGHPMDGVHGAEIVGDGSATDMTSTDGEGMTVYVQVVQWFNLRISPFAAAPSRLTVRLTLHKEGELYYIAAQEDLFHPADLASYLLPPVTPLVSLALSTAGLVSNVGARISELFGSWPASAKGERRDDPLLNGK